MSQTIRDTLDYMRSYIPDEGKYKLLRFDMTDNYFCADRETLTRLIDNFEKRLITAGITEEKFSPLEAVGVRLLLDMIGYDPRKNMTSIL